MAHVHELAVSGGLSRKWVAQEQWQLKRVNGEIIYKGVGATRDREAPRNSGSGEPLPPPTCIGRQAVLLFLDLENAIAVGRGAGNRGCGLLGGKGPLLPCSKARREPRK